LSLALLFNIHLIIEENELISVKVISLKIGRIIFKVTDFHGINQIKTSLNSLIYNYLTILLTHYCYYTLFDIFISVSREDPFPLVCMENAALAKPIICFEGSGGMPGFVQDDAGFVVPYLDVDTMADKIHELYQNKTLRQKLGENAKKKMLNNYSMEKSIESIIEIIKRNI